MVVFSWYPPHFRPLSDVSRYKPLYFVSRMIVCNQVMKFILDKIEKDEKQAAKKRKKEEVVEQKRSKQNATKLTALLYKHKEQLKSEILKKRALLDKELQLQVQVSAKSTFTMMVVNKIQDVQELFCTSLGTTHYVSFVCLRRSSDVI